MHLGHNGGKSLPIRYDFFRTLKALRRINPVSIPYLSRIYIEAGEIRGKEGRDTGERDSRDRFGSLRGFLYDTVKSVQRRGKATAKGSKQALRDAKERPCISLRFFAFSLRPLRLTTPLVYETDGERERERE